MSKFNDTNLVAQASRTQLDLLRDLKREKLERVKAGRDILSFTQRMARTEDGGPFQVDPFHQTVSAILDKFIDDIAAKRSPRIILTAPSRCGKTELTVRSLLPCAVGRFPEWECKVLTHSQELADMHGRDIRVTMTDPLYHSIYPNVTVDPKRQASADMGIIDPRTNRPYHGSLKCMGIDGGVVGQGAMLMVIDDPHKNMEEARSGTITQKIFESYQSGLAQRVAPGGGILIMATRWTELDLIGRILDSPMGQRFEVYSFPAFDENDVPLCARHEEMWREARETVDVKIWSSMYMCNPFAAEGTEFLLEDLEGSTVPSPPDLKNCRVFITSDPANKETKTSDYWATLVWALDSEDNLTLIDHVHKRNINALEYIDDLFALAAKYKPYKVWVEDCPTTNAIRALINRTMRERRAFFGIEYMPTGGKDKLSRSSAISARVRQGKVKFVQCPFLSQLFREMVSFPDGKNDDLVDCCSMAGKAIETLMPPVLPNVVEKDVVPYGSPDYFDQEAQQKGPDQAVFEGYARRPAKLF